jgi:outer membrane protein assembly factor BamB
MANTGTKKHGKDGAIYVDGTKVAVKTEWTLSLARDTVEATTFGDTNKTYLVGLRDISGTYAGLLDLSGDVMLTAAGEDAKLVALHAEDGTEVASGSGFIDASITCSNTDAVRITGNFRAQGPWTVL